MPDRAKNQVVNVHGWSDTSDSFAPLAQFLEARDFPILDLFLADYISMDDDVSIEDAAKAMQAAVEAKITGGELRQPFDLIVHSPAAWWRAPGSRPTAPAWHPGKCRCSARC